MTSKLQESVERSPSQVMPEDDDFPSDDKEDVD